MWSTEAEMKEVSKHKKACLQHWKHPVPHSDFLWFIQWWIPVRSPRSPVYAHMFPCTRAILSHTKAHTQTYSMCTVLSYLATDCISQLHCGSNPHICIIIFNELSPWSVKIHKDLYSLLWHLKVNICIVHFKLDVQCLLKIMGAGSLVCLMTSFLIIAILEKI